MRVLSFLTLIAVALSVDPVMARDLPISHEELNSAGFKHNDLKRLSEEEVTEFYQAYPRDHEMLERVKLGTIHKNPMKVCIAGPAPAIEEALEKFPLYYPRTGRIEQISGTFEWKGKQLLFRIDDQPYTVMEHHLVYRLQQMGIEPGKEAKPVPATIQNAVWQINPESGLQIIYLQKVVMN